MSVPAWADTSAVSPALQPVQQPALQRPYWRPQADWPDL
jgi:hypothetical protein